MIFKTNSNGSDEQAASLPILPVKNTVLFPHMVIPLSVGRPSSIAAVNAAMATPDKKIIIVAQRDAAVELPGPSDIFTVGTQAVVQNLARRESGLEFLAQGLDRVVILKIDSNGFLRARTRSLPMPQDVGSEVEAMERTVAELMQRILEMTSDPQIQVNVEELLRDGRDPIWLAYVASSIISLDTSKRQALLEAHTRLDALRMVHGFLTHEMQVLELRQKIVSAAASEVSKEQREYMLRQQLHAIQEELGEKSGEKAGVDLLRKKLAEIDLPDDVRKEADRELSRLEKLPVIAPDYQLISSYLELVTELPWRKSVESAIDVARARQVLDEDHFDIKDVKERILEYLAVMKLNPKAHAPILCFVGPPGVGKTSLGQSIARAIGRKFERMSLGGLHDEAELRGHRRTYIGAMPGRILQALRRAGANNPVLMLDEIDKIGHDFRGDPASALLEILDPAQNNSFRDNYLDLPFDLSKVFFIGTANAVDTIPRVLLDRTEVLFLAGYSPDEKMEIAKRYLIPRQVTEAGLTPHQFQILDQALQVVIARYTREAGVRELERSIARLARKAAQHFAEGHTQPVIVKADDLSEMLGPERHMPERARTQLPVGVAAGLAWTEAGGEILYVEATLLPSGKGLRLTGLLGHVMKESAEAAQSYIWSHAEDLGIDASLFKGAGVHIHVPAGAVPKDGPSAGVAMAAALASLYTKLPGATDMAMTGEISLAGLVLPVGGIKEKVLAAHRAGIRRIVLPADNQKDLRDIPQNVRDQLQFVFANRIEQVLEAVLPKLAERLRLHGGADE
jgi:ATP-dependent Lon protease